LLISLNLMANKGPIKNGYVYVYAYVYNSIMIFTEDTDIAIFSMYNYRHWKMDTFMFMNKGYLPIQ
jgi:hypothetical protein